MSSNTRTERTVGLFLRPDPELGVEGRKEAVVDELAALERAGVIDGTEVQVWGSSVRPTGPLEGSEYHDRVLDRIGAFRGWLERSGARPEFTFGRREVSSSITGEQYFVVDLPSVCLAVYDGGELAGVYPHHDGETVVTVADALQRLAGGRDAPALHERVSQ